MTEIIKAFIVGGAICAIGQLFIDFTKLTPARILTGYVVAGVVLSALGLYRPLADFAGAGASVPLTGFGHALAEGMKKAVDEGIPADGYYHWSFTDNFEWQCGFARRFGLVYIDYRTQKRIKNESGRTGRKSKCFQQSYFFD